MPQLLQGWDCTEKERKGRIVTTWLKVRACLCHELPAARWRPLTGAAPGWRQVGEPEPLPCRQELEERHPEAFITCGTPTGACLGTPSLPDRASVLSDRPCSPILPRCRAEELEASYAGFVETLGKTKPALEAGCRAVPVVLASHVWEGEAHPDPTGSTLGKLAKQLGTDLPGFQQWGFKDVGVFFDWSSLHQAANGYARTAEQEQGFKVAQSTMSMWCACLKPCGVGASGPRTRRGAATPFRIWQVRAQDDLGVPLHRPAHVAAAQRARLALL